MFSTHAVFLMVFFSPSECKLSFILTVQDQWPLKHDVFERSMIKRGLPQHDILALKKVPIYLPSQS